MADLASGLVLGPTYDNIRKTMKWVIIINGIVCHVSTSVAFFGAFNSQLEAFAQAYRYIEKIQMTSFTIQEFVLSGLYVWRTLDIIKAAPDGNSRRKRIMRELLGINVLIIIMDIALLVVEYQNRHVIEQAVKEVVYAFKLKLEFAILNKLISITQQRNNSFEEYTAFGEPLDGNANAFTHPAAHRFQSDATAVAVEPGDKADIMHIERMAS